MSMTQRTGQCLAGPGNEIEDTGAPRGCGAARSAGDGGEEDSPPRGGDGQGGFDFAFIDAEKINHDAYHERALLLVRCGGLIVLDNEFWEGPVLDGTIQDPDTVGVRALNLKLRYDTWVSVSTSPLSDGLTLARKRRRPRSPW